MEENKHMKKKMAAGLGIFTVGAIALASSLTVAQQNEYQLVRQFGKVKRIIEEPGIYFKVPFVESVSTLPKETLIYDLTPSDVITKDKKTMICDSYVLWRIEDPLKFAQALNSSLSNAESRLNTSVYNATKNVISSMDQDQVISGRTGSLSEKVMENIGTNMEQYGIKLLSFETKQLDLPNDNKEAGLRAHDLRAGKHRRYLYSGRKLGGKGDPEHHRQGGGHSDLRCGKAGGDPGGRGRGRVHAGSLGSLRRCGTDRILHLCPQPRCPKGIHEGRATRP